MIAGMERMLEARAMVERMLSKAPGIPLTAIAYSSSHLTK